MSHSDEETASNASSDDEEPLLKYQRISSPALTSLLRRDAVSAMATTPKFIVLGTHWGVVLLMDAQGNEIKSWLAHQATVNSVSVDEACEHVASASDDGKMFRTVVDVNARRPCYC